MKLDSIFDYTIIKKYKYWNAMVATNQTYLGKCVIWCIREDATELNDATDEEMLEFKAIIDELRPAVEKAFSPDLFNYSFLGNGTRHLHCHFVPRYENVRVFNGKEYLDERWGGNFLAKKECEANEEEIEIIKQEILKHLN